MDIKKQFATDSELELNGAWVVLEDKTKIKIARWQNSRFMKRIKELHRRYGVKTDVKNMPEETVQKAEKALIETMASTILLDWEGITEDGKAVAYSEEKAIEYLSIHDFRDEVMGLAIEAETFRRQAVEELEKN